MPNFHTKIFLFFVFLGLVLSLLFFVRKIGDRFSNRVLGVYTFLFSYEMLHGCLKWSGNLPTKYFVHLTETHALVWLLYGPLIYIYVRRAVTEVKFKKTDLIFLVPPAVIFYFYVPFYMLATNQKIAVVENNQIYEYAQFPSYAIWVVIALLFFYGGLTYYKFRDFKKVGYRERVWLKWFVGSYVGFAFLFFAYVFLVRFNFISYKFDYLVDGAITFFIFMLAYFGFAQPDVFSGKKKLRDLIPFIKYKKTGLSEVLALELKDKLETLMEEEKPYLINHLRLDDLAGMMNVSRNHTSQIINEYFNLSFFDFVNQYRVNEARTMMLNNESEKLNVTQIAYSAGFNNRASFYKAFKKFTNRTPTSYMEHLNVS